jgi:C-22 sterol desaturase
MAANASFVSPTADAKVAHMITQLDGNSILSTIYNGLSVWSVLFTVLAVAVAYDQCMDRTTQCAGFC